MRALRTYWAPVAGLVCTLPIVVYALLQSSVWPGRTFPGFFVTENGVVPNVSALAWPPDAAVFHAQVVAVNDRPVTSNTEIYQLVAAQPVGTPFEFRLRKLGSELVVQLASRRFGWADYLQTFGILLAFGAVSAGMALAVGFLQPRTAQGRVYLLSGCIAGLYPILGTLLYGAEAPLLARLYSVTEALFPATWIHLALVFPVERALPGGRRPWLVVPYAISAALAAWMLRGLYATPPDMSGVYMTYQFTALAIVFFAGAMLYAYFERPEALARRRLRPVFAGLVAATFLPLLTFAVNAAAQVKIPAQFGLVLAPVFYLAVLYSIARHELFDVERAKRQAALYGLLSLVLAATYGLVLAATSVLAPGHAYGIAAVVFAVVVTLGIEPAKSALQRGLDRAFRRGETDHRAALSALSQTLTTLLDLPAVVRATTQVTADAMNLDTVVLATGDARTEQGMTWTYGDGTLQGPRADRRLPAVIGVLADAPDAVPRGELVALAQGQDASVGVDAFLGDTRAVLVLPLRWHERVVGLLGLGARAGHRPFSPEDREFLRTLANQVAVALVNAQSYEALRELNRNLDERVRRQASQLVQAEKMASLGQLVAGVAHELNNPASFIYGAIESLKDFTERYATLVNAYRQALPPEATAELQALERRLRLDALLRETPELLRFCSEGADRIKHIVDDLRTFARADRGERTLTNVRAGIDSTVALLWKRITQAGVRLKQDYQDTGLIQANPGQLNQVWMNVLTNALDAVEGRPAPEVVVSLRETPGSSGDDRRRFWVEVQITDNGCGMSAEVREHVFEPFFTTKRVGHGTGLGMSIVYSVVTSHGGTIEVHSEEGAGSRLTIRLPSDGGAPTPEPLPDPREAA